MDILTQLATVTGIKFQRMWNDQLNLDETQEQYSFPMPAVFVEFLNDQEIKQLGDGLQLYDNLIVRLHILHMELDAADGTMEQNLNVFDFMQEVYKKMQRFEPAQAAAFVRVSEARDYLHGNVYHGIQDYKTNYVDNSMQISTDGTTIDAGDVTLVPTVIYDPTKPYLKHKT